MRSMLWRMRVVQLLVAVVATVVVSGGVIPPATTLAATPSAAQVVAQGTSLPIVDCYRYEIAYLKWRVQHKLWLLAISQGAHAGPGPKNATTRPPRMPVQPPGC